LIIFNLFYVKEVLIIDDKNFICYIT
jgi:hypothetical protein